MADDDTTDAPAIPVDDLIAFGLLWEQHLLEPSPPGTKLFMSPAFLRAYVVAANRALQTTRTLAAKRTTGGRPRGGGMGDMVARLKSAGLPEDEAIRAVALKQHKPEPVVRRAYEKNPRAERAVPQKTPATGGRVRKKPPRSTSSSAKNPRVRHRR